MSRAVEIEDLGASLNGREILTDINLTLPEGRFLGIVGPNGGGKTTLLRIILGLVKRASGRLQVFGKTPKDAAREGLFGYLPQHMNVDTSFPATSLDVVLMGLYGKGGAFRRISKNDKNRAGDMLKTMGMAGYEDHIYGRLSGGQQQRVSIARALMSEPRLLILDEPSTGIDVVGQEDFYTCLRDFKRNSFCPSSWPPMTLGSSLHMLMRLPV